MSRMSEKTVSHNSIIKHLNDKANVDYKGKKPFDIYTRLPNIYERADNHRINGDEEKQYIFLRRWLNSVEWLKSTKEYRHDKNASLTNMQTDQIKLAKETLASLSVRLDSKYKLQQKEELMKERGSTEKMDVDNENESSYPKYVVDGPIKLPETPTGDPLVGDDEEIINCDQLFQLMQKENDRYLIIDIRQKSEYQDSRIRSDRSVNIPNSIIVPGALTAHFEKYLLKENKESLNLFRQRGAQYVDVIILLDWNTSSKKLTSESHLNILRKILENWDLGIKYKRITILDGGYKEWLTRYPTFTTNPNITEPISNNIPKETLDNIEYPMWIHSNEEERDTKPSNDNTITLKVIDKDDMIAKDRFWFKKTGKEISDSMQVNNFMNTSTEVEKSTKNNVIAKQYDNNLLNAQRKRTLSIMKKHEITGKPTVDRSSKPVALDMSNSESKLILNLMRQLHELMKSKEELTREILEQEHTIYGNKSKDSNEQEHMRENMVSLNLKLEAKEMEHKIIEEKIAEHASKIETIKFSASEETEKRHLELALTALKRRLEHTSTERKKIRESVKNTIEESTMKEPDSNVYKEPLKMDNNLPMGGNLERSYSSPNLHQNQSIGRKAPRVDRSSKPQVPLYERNGTYSENKMSHLSSANREERMTPVHGSVQPGVTGLKNLGNSCYMNSIIQCLSNTTHLAKYFIDSFHTDDLNTNNDNNSSGQVVEEVAQVIKALWRGQYKSISPHDLKIVVGQYKLQFESYEQQDSHEFLTFLLDWMHNDLKKNCEVPAEMTVAEKAWYKAMGSQRSIISDFFFGQLRSTITCIFCKQSSTTYETYNSLTMSLPHANRCTLNDCIVKFVSGQKVIGWKCPKCQTPREATKKFDFVKLAPIIVIHLNRFAESGGWLEKRNTAVDFPLTDFNLKPYLVTDDNSPTISNIRSYSLYAMSNHYGTMEGGHYTAFCKNPTQNKWYKYDDQTVTEVTMNQVKSQNTSAYLLFYTSFSSNII